MKYFLLPRRKHRIRKISFSSVREAAHPPPRQNALRITLRLPCLKRWVPSNIADNAPILLDGLSIEEIIDADPDYIFISTMGDEEAAKEYMDSVLAEPTWQSLTAVQTGNYSYLPKDLFQFKPNNRWDEAYAFLAGLLYGE